MMGSTSDSGEPRQRGRSESGLEELFSIYLGVSD